MAEQIPYNVIADILVKLGTSIIQELGSAYCVGQELTALKPKLDIINGVLVDAEEKQVESHAVRAWLRRVRDVVYDADDLLDDFVTHGLQRGGVARQVSNFFSSSNQVVFRVKMGNKIKQIKKEVDAIVNQIPPMLNLIQGSRVHGVENRWRDTHSFALASEIVGREENKEEIVKLLLSSDDEDVLSMVAIVGIGGLGKTTLAQLVYNDKEVVHHFELRTWVCVSDNFDVRELIIKILKDVCEQDGEKLELNGLKDLLHKNLIQKRCLLVLDDVWNENCERWDQLKGLLMVVGKGSKILVTTRERHAASIMGIDSPFVLEGLKEAQSWDLFCKITSMDKLNKMHPKLVDIGKEIVPMCKGVPLIIKTLGSILRLRPEENWWLSVKNNKNLLSLGAQNKNVLSVLKLSYNNLPIYLKQCFTFCAIFPKDYEIEKKSLVQLWMAQGYIQPLDARVGDRYFDELLSRSLFEESRKDDSNNILTYKMHDLIHDVAQSIIGSEILALEDGVKIKSERVHHVLIQEAVHLKQLDLKLKHIRTLLYTIPYHYSKDDPIPKIEFSGFDSLRVLSLEGLYLTKVPEALGTLSHLRYLDLSSNDFEELPDSVTRLRNLETLKLFVCTELKRFPEGIRKLTNMRHWENDLYLSHMPCGIGELSLLQSLPMFVVGGGRGVGRLNELKELNNLRGELRIVKLKNARKGDGDANLRAKQYIQSLRLEWGWLDPRALREDEYEWVMEGLQPHPNLRELYISGYGGLKFPSWGMMRNGDWLRRVLPNLTTIHLESCSRCRILPCLVGLPHLKSLELRDLKEVEKMECSPEGSFFPSLEKLTLHHMPNLKELWRRDLPSFSCLSQLMITECDNLAFLELHSSPLLSRLVIRGCDNLASLELRTSPLLSTSFISGCCLLTSLQLPPSPHLSQVKISKCDSLASLELHSSPLLSNLQIWQCPKLTCLKLPSFPCLEELTLYGVKEWVARQFISLATGPSLKSVSIQNIDDLRSLPDELRQHVHVSTLIRKMPKRGEGEGRPKICSWSNVHYN